MEAPKKLGKKLTEKWWEVYRATYRMGYSKTYAFRKAGEAVREKKPKPKSKRLGEGGVK